MNPFKYGCAVDGKYFCQRPKLAKRLKEYIKSGQNVVIQGERRMGKTSLVLETVRGMKGIALFHADFLCVRDQFDLCKRLLTAIARLESSEGWLAKTIKTFAYLKPTFSIDPTSGAPTLSVDARLASEPTTLDAILDTLLAQTAKRKVCAVLDEFQDILDLEDGERILAIMRARIQLDSNTPYIFLGSVRNRMTNMFWHPSSPFYHSAAAFPVGGIDPDDFFAFISSRFAIGRRSLDRAAFDVISSIANDTPGYIQEFCDAIWDETTAGDTIDNTTIERALNSVFSREQEHFTTFMRQLTAHQTRILKNVATLGGKAVCSKEFLSASATYNASSVKVALSKIEKAQILYWFDGDYRFVNPFFREWLRRQ